MYLTTAKTTCQDRDEPILKSNGFFSPNPIGCSMKRDYFPSKFMPRLQAD